MLGVRNDLIHRAPYIFPTALGLAIFIFSMLKHYEWVWIFFGVVFAFQYILHIEKFTLVSLIFKRSVSFLPMVIYTNL